MTCVGRLEQNHARDSRKEAQNESRVDVFKEVEQPYKRCKQVHRKPKRKLLVLDVNGVLVDANCHEKSKDHDSLWMINGRRGTRIICNLLLLMLVICFF